jgi:hypothetical protein
MASIHYSPTVKVFSDIIIVLKVKTGVNILYKIYNREVQRKRASVYGIY